jgi:ATP-binding cassette subfamily F protein uup
MTEKERRELDALPGRIETLEAEQHQLHVHMADPAFYRSAPEDIARARRRCEDIVPEIETCYRRWEELEAKATAAAG